MSRVAPTRAATRASTGPSTRDTGASVPGDTIIVISYAQYDRAEMEHYEPRVVHVTTGSNTIIQTDAQVATLLS
jgi:aspartate 1-decarboxylase